MPLQRGKEWEEGQSKPACTMSNRDNYDLSLDRLWRTMLSQSFNPRQWFEDEDEKTVRDKHERNKGSLGDRLSEQDDPDLPDLDDVLNGGVMWVYRLEDIGSWCVGYYSPDRVWHPESYYPTSDEAATRVRWLNGGDME